MANSVFSPTRSLRWHYRSRDPRLIAFSNKYVYDNNLVVFPSPDVDSKTKGVYYRKINGLYYKGTNPTEACEIVKAVREFMYNHRNMSLGVVLLNQKQRALVEEEMNFIISKDQSVREYIEFWEENNDGLESFFIKNLENVQGDERDVIFIGTVYGPEKENAPVMQRFGPINGINGKRRLNVLFSRAKHKIVTFSSMTSSDIKVTEQSNPGVALLKYWLEYCASGELLSYEETHKEPDSVFEEYVIDQLKSIGCQPVPQVGVSGYFIDIGVRHPKWPHGFIMGVECDGATYHSAKSARDRDRLREEVLTNMGWNLYRIWSTDWFSDPVKEAQKLRGAIESRLKELLASDQVVREEVQAPVKELEFSANSGHVGDLFGESSEEKVPTQNTVEIKTVRHSDGLDYGKCFCGETLSLASGQYGVYLKCLKCKKTQRIQIEAMQQIIEKDLKCPEHNVSLRLTSGRRGFFMGCPLYPRCSYTCAPKINPKFLP